MKPVTKNVHTSWALLLAATLAIAPATAQDLLISAQKIVVAPDTVLDDSAMLVRDGKVAYIGRDIPAEARTEARRIDYGTATISPGFVLAATTLGRDADLAESALPFTPDLRAVEAFDPWQEELSELAPQGVTSLGWSPSARNVAGGIGALVKPGLQTPGRVRGRVVDPEVFVTFSIANEARNPERAPTSLMGAKELLREAFDAARAGVEIGPDLAVLRQVMSGSRKALVHADTYAELNATLDLAARFNFAPVVIGARQAEKIMARLAKSGAGVVLDSLSPTARLADLRLPALLAEAGVPFCFAGRPDRMRMSAVLAVRYGLDRRTALAALTRTPAALLEQQATVGSLRQGCAADFVVFEGDLLDLTARHVATWIDGQRAFGAAPAAVGQAATADPTTASGER